MGFSLKKFTGGNYLKKDQWPPNEGMVATIDKITTAALDDGEPEKPILNFVEDLKPMVLNKTNMGFLISYFNVDDSDQLCGKQVRVYHNPHISFGGAAVGGLSLATKESVVS